MDSGKIFPLPVPLYIAESHLSNREISEFAYWDNEKFGWVENIMNKGRITAKFTQEDVAMLFLTNSWDHDGQMMQYDWGCTGKAACYLEGFVSRPKIADPYLAKDTSYCHVPSPISEEHLCTGTGDRACVIIEGATLHTKFASFLRAKDGDIFGQIRITLKGNSNEESIESKCQTVYIPVAV
jgi:hypothetical protein